MFLANTIHYHITFWSGWPINTGANSVFLASTIHYHIAFWSGWPINTGDNSVFLASTIHHHITFWSVWPINTSQVMIGTWCPHYYGEWPLNIGSACEQIWLVTWKTITPLSSAKRITPPKLIFYILTFNCLPVRHEQIQPLSMYEKNSTTSVC